MPKGRPKKWDSVEERDAFYREQRKAERLADPEAAKAKDRERYQHPKNKERRIKYQRNYRQEKPGKCLEMNRNHYNNNEAQRASVKNRQLKSVYGISLADLKEMLEKQDYKCAICNREVVIQTHENVEGKRDPKTAAVDHCHNFGHVRGALCMKCNIGLGCFEDDVAVMRKAAYYIEKAMISKILANSNNKVLEKETSLADYREALFDDVLEEDEELEWFEPLEAPVGDVFHYPSDWLEGFYK